MNEMKGWPFESLGDAEIDPCNGEFGGGGGFPG